MHAHAPLSLSVDQALDQLRASLRAVGSELVALDEALGRVLAQDVVAEQALPPFANASMDGYAVRAADVAPAAEGQPVRLQVIGDIAAGVAELPQVDPGQAARIMTGAPLPPGADCVIPVEHTSSDGPMAGQALEAEVEILEGAKAGEFVRPAGQDVSAGSKILSGGQRLRPQDVAMLAAQGFSRPRVYKRPNVAVLSTGDELVDVDEALVPGKIRDSNRYLISAFVEAEGARAIRLGIAADDPEIVRQRLDQAVELGADLIVSSAGVSMGAHDYVRVVLESRGELAFWRVNIRPGKPLAFGSYAGVPFLGLPGNPVSAWVTFAVFVRPAIQALAGEEPRQRLTVPARLDHALRSDGRESYLRAVVTRRDSGYRARLTGSQDSGVLSSLLVANALLIIPSGVTSVPQGEALEAWLMGGEGMADLPPMRQLP